jgi:tRNA modification GTPase
MKASRAETIVACSTPLPNPAATTAPRDVSRAIIRISGPRALEVVASVFEAGEGQSLKSESSGWRRVNGSVRWLSHSLPAHLYVMPAPNSFTCEDVVEVHLPGISWAISNLLERLIASGARMAQPGEFTRRAFENGRISLDQAEAVGALIRSQSADEARAYAMRLSQRKHTRFSALRSDIEELLALVELGLDFSHEDVGVLSPAEILSRIGKLRERAQEMLSALESASGTSEVHARLPRVVLAGPTNAGKSSLFNKLLGRDAAIVSATANTTRDVVESSFALSDSSCVLVDTAGFSSIDNGSEIHRAALEATHSSIAGAHILLTVLDGSVDFAESAEALAAVGALKHAQPSRIAIIWSKADLAPADLFERAERIDKFLPHIGAVEPRQFDLSSVSGHGIAELRRFLEAELAGSASRFAEAGSKAEAAARNAMESTAAALDRAFTALESEHGEDVVAVELREALHAFWQAEGVLVRHDAVTEAMLDRIFSSFCIGK